MAYGSVVKKVEPIKISTPYKLRVTVQDLATRSSSSIYSGVVVNCSGLYADSLIAPTTPLTRLPTDLSSSSQARPESVRNVKQKFAKGNYFKLVG